MKRFMRTMAAALAMFVGVNAAQADPGSTVPEPKPLTVKATRLTDDQLKEMLDRMGYEYKIEAGNGKQPNIYMLKVERDGWTYYLNVSLSFDGSLIWLFAPLKDLPPADKVPAERMEKIFAMTTNLGPAFFSLNKSRWLYLNVTLVNKDVTAIKLRSEIDLVLSYVRATEDLWNSAKWTTEAPKTPAENIKTDKKD